MGTIIKFQNSTEPCYYEAKQNQYLPLSEAQLRKQIPYFADLHEKARTKALKRFLRSSTVIDCGSIPEFLPNCKAHRDERGRKTSLSEETLQAGAKALLSMKELFQDPSAGFDLLGDLLGGMWCKELRAMEPEYHPVTVVNSTAPPIQEILTTLVRIAVPRKRWHKKRIKIWRKAVLDYQRDLWELPLHFQDFSRCRVPVQKKGYKALKLPCAYEDTVALIIGASSQQLQEAAPYLQYAAVFLLNCASCASLPSRRVNHSAISVYDPQILEGLQQERTAISHILRCWWSRGNFERARCILYAARASFGPQDSRYISVSLDPRKLRQAIHYQLLLAFLDMLKETELLTVEELTPIHTAVRDIYDPQPLLPQPERRAEDREVFLATMVALAEDPSIAAVGEPYRKGEKRLGAWRVISGVRYLVMPESVWAKAYVKQVRMDKSIQCGLFQTEYWERDFQKILCEAELIKAASSGYRYRYDLYGNGTRDTTYVVAVPETLLRAS